MELENNRSDMGFPNILEEEDGRSNPAGDKPRPLIDRPVYSAKETGDAPEKPEGETNYGVFLVAIIFLIAIGITYLNQTGVIKIPSLSQPAVSANRLSDAENGLKVETLRSIGLLNELEVKYAGNPEKLEKIRKLKSKANAMLILLGN